MDVLQYIITQVYCSRLVQNLFLARVTRSNLEVAFDERCSRTPPPHTHIHTQTYIYTHTRAHTCVCWERERERERDKLVSFQKDFRLNLLTQIQPYDIRMQDPLYWSWSTLFQVIKNKKNHIFICLFPIHQIGAKWTAGRLSWLV